MWGSSINDDDFQQTADIDMSGNQTHSVAKVMELEDAFSSPGSTNLTDSSSSESEATSSSFVFIIQEQESGSELYRSETVTISYPSSSSSVATGYLSLDARGLALNASCGSDMSTKMLMCFDTLAAGYVMGFGSIRTSTPATLTWKMYDNHNGHSWDGKELYSVVDEDALVLSTVSNDAKLDSSQGSINPVFAILPSLDADASEDERSLPSSTATAAGTPVMYNPSKLLKMGFARVDAYPPKLTLAIAYEYDAVLVDLSKEGFASLPGQSPSSSSYSSDYATSSSTGGDEIDHRVSYIQLLPAHIAAQYVSDSIVTSYAISSDLTCCPQPALRTCEWQADKGIDCCDAPPEDPWATFSVESTYTDADFNKDGNAWSVPDVDSHGHQRRYTYYPLDPTARELQWPIVSSPYVTKDGDKNTSSGSCEDDDSYFGIRCQQTLSSSQKYNERTKTVGVRESLVCDPRISDPPGIYSTKYGYGLGPRWFYDVQKGPYLSAPQWREAAGATDRTKNGRTIISELSFDKNEYYKCVGGSGDNPNGYDASCGKSNDQWACGLAMRPAMFTTLVTNEMAYYNGKPVTAKSDSYPNTTSTFQWQSSADMLHGYKCLYHERGAVDDVVCTKRFCKECYGEYDGTFHKDVCRAISTCNTTVPATVATTNYTAAASSENNLYASQPGALVPTSVIQFNDASKKCAYDQSRDYGALQSTSKEPMALLSTSGTGVKSGGDDGRGLCCTMRSGSSEAFGNYCAGPMTHMDHWNTAPRTDRYTGDFGAASFRSVSSSLHDYPLAFDHISSTPIGGYQKSNKKSHNAFEHEDFVGFKVDSCGGDKKGPMQFDKYDDSYPTNLSSSWSWSGAINYELILSEAFRSGVSSTRSTYESNKTQHDFTSATTLASAVSSNPLTCSRQPVDETTARNLDFSNWPAPTCLQYDQDHTIVDMSTGNTIEKINPFACNASNARTTPSEYLRQSACDRISHYPQFNLYRRWPRPYQSFFTERCFYGETHVSWDWDTRIFPNEYYGAMRHPGLNGPIIDGNAPAKCNIPGTDDYNTSQFDWFCLNTGLSCEEDSECDWSNVESLLQYAVGGTGQESSLAPPPAPMSSSSVTGRYRDHVSSKIRGVLNTMKRRARMLRRSHPWTGRLSSATRGSGGTDGTYSATSCSPETFDSDELDTVFKYGDGANSCWGRPMFPPPNKTGLDDAGFSMASYAPIAYGTQRQVEGGEGIIAKYPTSFPDFEDVPKTWEEAKRGRMLGLNWGCVRFELEWTMVSALTDIGPTSQNPLTYACTADGSGCPDLTNPSKRTRSLCNEALYANQIRTFLDNLAGVTDPATGNTEVGVPIYTNGDNTAIFRKFAAATYFYHNTSNFYQSLYTEYCNASVSGVSNTSGAQSSMFDMAECVAFASNGCCGGGSIQMTLGLDVLSLDKNISQITFLNDFAVAMLNGFPSLTLPGTFKSGIPEDWYAAPRAEFTATQEDPRVSAKLFNLPTPTVMRAPDYHPSIELTLSHGDVVALFSLDQPARDAFVTQCMNNFLGYPAHGTVSGVAGGVEAETPATLECATMQMYASTAKQTLYTPGGGVDVIGVLLDPVRQTFAVSRHQLAYFRNESGCEDTATRDTPNEGGHIAVAYVVLCRIKSFSPILVSYYSKYIPDDLRITKMWQANCDAIVSSARVLPAKCYSSACPGHDWCNTALSSLCQETYTRPFSDFFANTEATTYLVADTSAVCSCTLSSNMPNTLTRGSYGNAMAAACFGGSCDDSMLAAVVGTSDMKTACSPYCDLYTSWLQTGGGVGAFYSALETDAPGFTRYRSYCRTKWNPLAYKANPMNTISTSGLTEYPLSVPALILLAISIGLGLYTNLAEYNKIISVGVSVVSAIAIAGFCIMLTLFVSGSNSKCYTYGGDSAPRCYAPEWAAGIRIPDSICGRQISCECVNNEACCMSCSSQFYRCYPTDLQSSSVSSFCATVEESWANSSSDCNSSAPADIELCTAQCRTEAKEGMCSAPEAHGCGMAIADAAGPMACDESENQMNGRFCVVTQGVSEQDDNVASGVYYQCCTTLHDSWESLDPDERDVMLQEVGISAGDKDCPGSSLTFTASQINGVPYCKAACTIDSAIPKRPECDINDGECIIRATYGIPSNDSPFAVGTNCPSLYDPSSASCSCSCMNGSCINKHETPTTTVTKSKLSLSVPGCVLSIAFAVLLLWPGSRVFRFVKPWSVCYVIVSVLASAMVFLLCALQYNSGYTERKSSIETGMCYAISNIN